jgi:hypothetical protein
VTRRRVVPIPIMVICRGMRNQYKRR